MKFSVEHPQECVITSFSLQQEILTRRETKKGMKTCNYKKGFEDTGPTNQRVGFVLSLLSAEFSEHAPCCVEDFFLKYSSVNNPCGNRGKPANTLENPGFCLWMLSG